MIPTFSVIIPTYNRENFIKKSVDSVLNQSFQDFELIVVDDGSNDNTGEVLNGYLNKLIYIYQENKGPSSARNRGLEKAQGKYIAFLDSDDKWTKNKLKEVNKCIIANPEIKIFHTQEKWYKKGKIHNPKRKHRKPEGYIFENCLRICSVSISTAVVKRNVFKDIGKFDESLPVCEDYDFWIRASLKYYIYLIDKNLTIKDGGRNDQLSMLYHSKDKFRVKAIENLIKNNDLDKHKYSKAFKELKEKCNIYANGCIKRNNIDEGKKYLDIPNKIEKYYYDRYSRGNK